jgi:hypothetical protein
MGLAVKQAGGARTLWVFDTFDGLPAPSENDPDYDAALRFTGKCVGTLEQVQSLLDSLGLTEYILRPGLFKDTLRTTDTGQIAVLHIDGDWYESTKTCLEALWERVSPGGIVQIDDYGTWEGCRKAVDEFLAQHDIRSKLRYVDSSGKQIYKQQC